MSNKRINKAYVRYDGTGRVIPGSLILNRFKPAVGNWSEIDAYECCNPASILALRLLFDSIANANALVGDASSVSDWNTFFDLPTNGNPFTSVVIVGNEVHLYGGSNIVFKDDLFKGNQYLLSIIDGISSVVSLLNSCLSGVSNLSSVSFPAVTLVDTYVFEYIDGPGITSISLPSVTFIDSEAFYYQPAITTFSFPTLTTVKDYAFDGCSAATTFYLPSLTDLGETVLNNGVFSDIVGNTITLTVPSALMTCNAGNPDGDIVYLQANNTVTVITV